MRRIKFDLRKYSVHVYYFLDSDTGDSFKPEEYKLVKNAIKEGHYVEAHYSEKDVLKHMVSSQVIKISKKHYSTPYRVFRYESPF